MSANIRDIVARIDANALGRIMYGQRELFHSNVLAWFFDAFPGIADSVFSPFTTPAASMAGPRKVERERENLDLVFHMPGFVPLVIENKVFSIPEERQLIEYDQKIANWRGESPARLLLTMAPPHFDLPANWRALDWRILAGRISAVLPTSDSFEVELMRRYVSLVYALHELLEITKLPQDCGNEPAFLTDEILNPIGLSPMKASLQKARARDVASRLEQRLVQTAAPNVQRMVPWGGTGGSRFLGVTSGLSRTHPMVSWFAPLEIREGRILAGFQYQENAFRRAIVFLDSDLQGDKAKQERERIATRHPELFTFPFPEWRHEGNRDFNHFNPDFVYKYAKVPAMPMEMLLAAAVAVRDSII